MYEKHKKPRVEIEIVQVLMSRMVITIWALQCDMSTLCLITTAEYNSVNSVIRDDSEFIKSLI